MLFHISISSVVTERVTVNNEAVGLTPTWRDYSICFGIMIKKSLIQTQFGEEPIIPITFLLWSKSPPLLSLNQLMENLIYRPHLLDKCNFCN